MLGFSKLGAPNIVIYVHFSERIPCVSSNDSTILGKSLKNWFGHEHIKFFNGFRGVVESFDGTHGILAHFFS